MGHVGGVGDRRPHNRSQIGWSYLPMALDLKAPLTFSGLKIDGGGSALEAFDVAAMISSKPPHGLKADPVETLPASKLPSEVFELAMVQIIE